MPVPQRVNLIVGWASCPSLKSLWKMVQDISKTKCHPTENLRKFDRPINSRYKSQKILFGLATLRLPGCLRPRISKVVPAT
ncbi:hypothetical protein [Microcoleus sp. B13-B6]|uniref:hypothetical protein n=1 Tax=Microcoleus sp. B13-B6 TaxID=2818652 RepID=UPI002FD4961B